MSTTQTSTSATTPQQTGPTKRKLGETASTPVQLECNEVFVPPNANYAVTTDKLKVVLPLEMKQLVTALHSLNGVNPSLEMAREGIYEQIREILMNWWDELGSEMVLDAVVDAS